MQVDTFLKGKDVSYPVAKHDGKVNSEFGVGGIPAAAVVKDGVIVWRGHPARLKPEKLKSFLNN